MSPSNRHDERHKSHRTAWLRATVLGANDGIVSTACLVLGVAASHATREATLVAGIAGLLAGALSMAVGEWVSVGSQKDTEDADIARETEEHRVMPDHELDELTHIYVEKGLSPELARRVAEELTEKDALSVHLAEELGITEATRARPMQAGLASAASFASGAALPLVAVAFSSSAARIALVAGTSIVALGLLGAIGAHLGGSPKGRATLRVVLGGLFAMAITTGVGAWVGTAL